MPEQQQNARLNEILIRILRGLLQYTGECWPWCSADHDGEQSAIQIMVADQQDDVHLMYALLFERGELIEFGAYPTDYTDLHFVSLDYLLDELVSEQDTLVEDLEQAVMVCGGDTSAQELLKLIVPRAKTHLEQLQKLAATGAAGNSASQ